MLRGDLGGLVGVDADRAVDKVVPPGKLDAGQVCAGGVADVHDGAHAMLRHRAKKRVAVPVKARVVVVRVGVENILHKKPPK